MTKTTASGYKKIVVDRIVMDRIMYNVESAKHPYNQARAPKSRPNPENRLAKRPRALRYL